MEPMKPMEPMEPMKPMKPMKPMAEPERWWPKDLGQPSSSGGQNGMRYAFFPQARRLLVEENGRMTTYDSGDNQINGVDQQGGASRSLTFSSDAGPVDVAKLKRLD